MSIQASTKEELEELEHIVSAMSTFLRAVHEALEPAKPPSLRIIEGSSRETKSTRRRRPALHVVTRQ